MLNHLNFKRLPNGQALITNDFGEYCFLSSEEFIKLIENNVDAGSELYDRLIKSHFIIDTADVFSSEFIGLLRGMKQYLFTATALHIFVVTNTCNLRCEYCQALAYKTGNHGFMDLDTAHKAVDIALQSPAKKLSFEFQGGEPLLNFRAIKEIIEYTKSIETKKEIEFNLVTNLTLLTDEVLDYLKINNVSISTSLDGPKYLHDLNRKSKNRSSSYDLTMASIQRIRAKHYNLGFIETTTRESLNYPKEIVREYTQLHTKGIFLRPLTPLGFAKDDWEKIGYTPEEYIQFYKSAFYEILDINKQGTFFPEQTATILLHKILHRQGINYMELRSPCGAGMGQLAYYYDGSIYTCDEARMLAEAGIDAFYLGDVRSSSYQSIVSSSACQVTCASSVIETIPGCCDCVYQPYCGVCPVVNYATENDVFPRKPNGYRCRINKGILDLLFDLLNENDSETIQILNSWVKEGPVYENVDKTP